MVNRKQVVAWCFYDWANSAFPTLITTFIFATFFVKKIALDTISGTSQWGYAQAIAGILITVLCPLLGAIADYSGYRKRWLAAATIVCVLASSALWFAKADPSFIHYALTVVIIGTVSFEVSMIFYNALLTTLVPKHYMGRVSGWGWGFGYIGGLTCLSIALLHFLHKPPSWLDTQSFQHLRIIGPYVGLWMALFSIPLFLYVPTKTTTSLPLHKAMRQGLRSLWQVLRKLYSEDKNLLWFLFAFMLYNDGLTTIFSFGGIYAAGTFGMDFNEVLQLGIVLNISAGSGALAFAWVADRVGARNTVIIALIGLLIPACCIVFVTQRVYFWIFSFALSLFVGPIQASSRSYLAKMIDADVSSELFGLYALSGKVTTFMAPWLLALITSVSNSQRVGFATVILFIVAGLLIMLRVNRDTIGDVTAPQ